MDRAPLCRRDASANARWGNALASVAGTYLFARASALLAGVDDAVNRMAGEAFVELCSGQLREVENAYLLDLSEEEHQAILMRKTGTLFALPCRLGAHLGGLPPASAAALAAYGEHLGLAFQIADDALDLIGPPGETGKAARTDLREGVYSLAIIRTLGRNDRTGARVRKILGQLRLSQADLEEIVALVVESGAVTAALDTARLHAERAQTSLVNLPANAARSSLEQLAEYAVVRTN
jgi:heptaprenyl diphosphate synthase